jgi:transmembrane sensor
VLVTSGDYAVSKVYKTDIGESKRVELDCGSHVELDTNTLIDVRFKHHVCTVELVRGMAYFEVDADAHRAFVVKAGRTLARVLGTAFSVRRHDQDHTTVLVTSGQVAVGHDERGGGVWSLAQNGRNEASVLTLSIVNAGQLATDNKGRLKIVTLDARQITNQQSWREGRFQFDDQRLGDVISEFNRYNRRQIRIMDPALAELRFSGLLHHDAVDTFLIVLEKSYGIEAAVAPGRGDVIDLRDRRDAP